MSMIAIGVGVAGAAASAYGAHQANAAASQRNANAGRVDVSTTNNPNPDVLPFMQQGLNRAGQALQNAPYAPANYQAYQSPFGGGGSGGNRGADPNLPKNPARRAAYLAARSGAAATPAAAAASAAPFQGQSTQTAQAIADAQRVASDMEHGPVTTAAQNYAAGTLSGTDQNAYRTETADMLRNQSDPDLQRYKDMLFASDTGLPGGGSGGGFTGGGGSGGFNAPPGMVPNGQGGWSPAPQAAGGGGPVGAAQFLKDILAGKDVPGADAMRARIKNQADEAYNSQVMQRKLAASGSGMYGGTGQLADEAYSEGKYGAGLADAYAAQDYALYGQALGLGTQEDMNAQNNAQSGANAALAASTSSGNNAASIAAANQQARLAALGGAVGMGVQQGQFQTSGMGSLAAGFSGDQQAAAANAGLTSGLGQQGYLAGGGLSLGSDQARVGWQGNQNQLRAAQIAGGNARAAINLQGQQFAQQQYEYNRQAPMNDVTQYAGILGSLYGNYGSQNTFGMDNRSGQSYVPPVNALGQGLAGAAAGYQLGSNIAGTYGANQQPAYPAYPNTTNEGYLAGLS